MFHFIRAAMTVAFVSVGSAALAVPINDPSLLPNGGKRAELPDLNTSLDSANTLTYVNNLDGRGTLTITGVDSFFTPFQYTDLGNNTTDFSVSSLSISATFDPRGEVRADLGGSGTGTFGGSFTVNGTPDSPIAGFTGGLTDPILTGILAAVGTSSNSIEIIWEVTGGRAAANFGTYAYTLIGSTSFDYNEFDGLSFFNLSGSGVGIDTKPGQVVPLPPAGLALLAGIGAFGLLRRKRRA